jgi:Ni2+-binding GTPase involved in maturation of urease and hydrogenase
MRTYQEHEEQIALKMKQLNDDGKAVIFVIAGANGAGKTRLCREVLTKLPFYQSFNLGLITKTIRCLTDMQEVSMLENFESENAERIFTRVIQYSCKEYQKNGVNLVIEGVQIDCKTLQDDENILGGVVLEVKDSIKNERNNRPDTHFKRKLEVDSGVDMPTYRTNDHFVMINNDGNFIQTYTNVLGTLEGLLDEKLANFVHA